MRMLSGKLQRIPSIRENLEEAKQYKSVTELTRSNMAKTGERVVQPLVGGQFHKILDKLSQSAEKPELKSKQQ